MVFNERKVTCNLRFKLECVTCDNFAIETGDCELSNLLWGMF